MSAQEPVFYVFVAEEGDRGRRLDFFVAQKTKNSDLSRSRVQALIDQGKVFLNGSVPKASRRLRAGDRVELEIPPPMEWDVLPEEIPLDAVYEDENVLVVNKPRGMVVHPAAGHRAGTLVNAVLARCPDLPGIGGEIRPGLVHRLDKDTTGLLVVAKDDGSMNSLKQQIKTREMTREYLALCKGNVASDRGVVYAPIGRHPQHRKRMAVSPGGKEATTNYRVILRFGEDYTLILASLVTGRTHQVRVHMAHMGNPILGDPVYSRTKGELGLGGQALHAVRLAFDHPATGERVDLRVPPPSDFAAALVALTRRYPLDEEQKEELARWLT